jgi:hypothetical protein
MLMQSIAIALLVTLTPAAALAQEAAGAQLWRLAAGTVPVPPALVTGGAAGLWNPAQPESLSIVALEVIQTAATVGAAGFVAALRIRVKKVGRLGVSYGRMSLGDLVRTTLSPDPDGAPVQYYTHTGRASWARTMGGTTLGAAVAFHETRLDDTHNHRWTFDVGGRQSIGDRIELAAATHFFSHVGANAAQDVYGGVQLRLWRGELWAGSGRATVHARYGFAVGNRYGVDQHIGTGLDVGGVFAADLLVVREGGYGVASWRPVAGVRLRIGRYRVLFAGDAGPRQVGAAYRVGLEVRER